MSKLGDHDDSWKDAIRAKLIQIYGSESFSANPLGLVQLFILLDSSDIEYSKERQRTTSPFWRTLRVAFNLKDNAVFKQYADGMIKDATEWKRDPEFLAKIASIYEQMADPSKAEFKEEFSLSKDFAKCSVSDMHGAMVGVGTGFARAWDVMTPTTKMEVVKVLKDIASNYRALSCIDECVSLVNKAGATVVMVGLAAVSISFACYQNVSRWYRGEISGKRCAKSCVDSIVEITAGVGGGVVGAMIGSAVMPVVGTFIGGVLGGLTAGGVAKLLIERLTMVIFDLPKEEALENAFKFLGVYHKASNDVINRAFRQKALRFHPDKGGNVQDFYQLQMQMAVIKVSRGEKY